MNRNQKIAIGCGGAGCLGLLVVAVVGAGLYFYYQRRPPMTNRNSNISIDSDRASDTNSSTNDSSSNDSNDSSTNDSSSNDSSNSNSSNSSDETPSSSMSNDDKHKLFQAAGMTYDNVLILRVQKKIGFASGAGSDYEEFVRDHISWSVRNVEFISSVASPDKARAYVEAHLND